MFKRIGLFILTNLAILVMLSIILNLVSWFFGVDFSQIAGAGQNYVSLLIFAAIIGFSGSIISLLMSKTIAKNSMGVQLIDVDHPRNEVERWLVETVAKLAKIKGVAMPEVGLYHGEPNAFATGPSKNNSLVAVSDGLLASMNKEEVEAVLGHEMSHVANGDMVTMTLMQGVINTFVVFLSRVIGNIVDRGICAMKVMRRAQATTLQALCWIWFWDFWARCWWPLSRATANTGPMPVPLKR